MNTENTSPAESSNVSSATPAANPPAKKKKPAKKAAPKKPAGKSAKQKLAEGAAKIRKAQADAKKPAAKKPAKDAGQLEIFAPIVESKDEIGDILARRVQVNGDWKGVKIAKDTPLEEYLPIFDHFAKSQKCSGMMLGDVINFGEQAYGSKYAAAMASTGRPISSLRKLASAAARVPLAIRKMHPAIGDSHCLVLAKCSDVGTFSETVKKIADEAKQPGHDFPSVRELGAIVDKIKPKKKKGKPAKPKKEKAEVITMSVLEREHFADMLDAASKLDHLIGSGAYALDISSAEKLPLREKLDSIARFAAQLRD